MKKKTFGESLVTTPAESANEKKTFWKRLLSTPVESALLQR